MKLANIIVAVFMTLTIASISYASEPLFDSRIDYNCGTDPRSVVATDLDGDVDQDLAVAN